MLGMLGGSFIPIENLPGVIAWLPKLTLNYWGIDGFFRLAAEDAPIGDITHESAGAGCVFGAVVFTDQPVAFQPPPGYLGGRHAIDYHHCSCTTCCATSKTAKPSCSGC